MELNTYSLMIMLKSNNYTIDRKVFIHEFRDDKCIVDVRDVVSGQVIPYNKFINKYVIRIEPHRAILEPDYFIKLIEGAEA